MSQEAGPDAALPIHQRPTKKFATAVPGTMLSSGQALLRRDPRAVKPLLRSTLESLREQGDMISANVRLAWVGELQADAAAPTAVAAPPRPEAGEALGHGRYLILDFVAEGGMGSVFKVFDQDLNRVVALKILHPDKDPSRELLDRFIEEAQITGQLQHPNIVPVYDFGLAESSRVYYTMKYVTGRNLQQVLEAPREESPDRPGGLWEKLDMFRKIARAVAYAHAKGVLHRDLKPSNILVGKYGEVLVLDWGLAKVLEAPLHQVAPAEVAVEPPAEERPRSDRVETLRSMARMETQSGSVAGTPNYMAPEQTTGDPSAVEVRTDVYALGGVLYAILTGGQPPHLGREFYAVIDAVRTARIVPPRERCPSREIPERLEAITLRALSRKPADRYADVEAMLADLDTFVEVYSATLDRRTRAVTRHLQAPGWNAGWAWGLAALAAGIGFALGALL